MDFHKSLLSSQLLTIATEIFSQINIYNFIWSKLNWIFYLQFNIQREPALPSPSSRQPARLSTATTRTSSSSPSPLLLNNHWKDQKKSNLWKVQQLLSNQVRSRPRPSLSWIPVNHPHHRQQHQQQLMYWNLLQQLTTTWPRSCQQHNSSSNQSKNNLKRKQKQSRNSPKTRTAIQIWTLIACQPRPWPAVTLRLNLKSKRRFNNFCRHPLKSWPHLFWKLLTVSAQRKMPTVRLSQQPRCWPNTTRYYFWTCRDSLRHIDQ